MTNYSPQPSRRIPIDRRVVVAVGVLVLILVLLLVVPSLITSTIIRLGNQEVGETTVLETTAQRINNLMVDQETGERGYIITGDERFLEPYNRGRSELADLWSTAAQQAAQVGGQAPALLAAVKDAATAWQDQIAAPEIVLVKSGQRSEVMSKVAAGSGKQFFDDFRSDANDLIQYVGQLRIEQTNQRTQLVVLNNYLLIALVAAALLAVAILFYLSNVSRRYQIQVARSEEVSRAKDEFLSIASHELKTPITSVKGYAQALLRRATKVAVEGETVSLTQEQWQHTLGNIEIIERQAGKMGELIDELLDVRRIHSQQLELQRHPTDLVTLAYEAVEQLRATSEHRLTYGADVSSIEVEADPSRIEQVLFNLISNAIKYSPDGGEVKVKVWIRDGEAICAISDEGIGIPKDEQSRLFERFYRASNAAHSAIGGIGLGLYISSVIISLHGGRMWLESEPGRGSTFYFSLPLVSAQSLKPQTSNLKPYQ